MFPGVDGFHWTASHIIFLGLFFAVAITIFSTLISAAWRSARDVRSHRAAELCWKSEFSELPQADRRCRHELAGRIPSRMCDNAFDCRTCEKYAQLADLPPRGAVNTLGLDYPEDRLYHRGHTWVKAEDDGTLTIGLDELANHLVGDPDSVNMPEVGEELELNGTAWHMKKHGKDIRVRAPIEGTIIGTGGPKKGWYVKIRPRLDINNPVTMRHLLRGPEINGWLAREMERLQLQLQPINASPTLADGGVLMPKLMDALPNANWETVLADTFLES